MRIIIFFPGISKKNYSQKNEHNLLKPSEGSILIYTSSRCLDCALLSKSVGSIHLAMDYSQSWI